MRLDFILVAANSMNLGQDVRIEEQLRWKQFGVAQTQAGKTAWSPSADNTLIKLSNQLNSRSNDSKLDRKRTVELSIWTLSFAFD